MQVRLYIACGAHGSLDTNHGYTPHPTQSRCDRIFRMSDPEGSDSRDPVIHDTVDLCFPQWQVATMSWYYRSSVNLNYGHWNDFFNSTLITMETGIAVLGEAWM
jgi:hypothetical protein